MVMLRHVLEDWLSIDKTQGIVVFSSAAPLYSRYGSDAVAQVQSLNDFFSETSTRTNVMMPSFPRLIGKSPVNLDVEQGTNGLLAEDFRRRFPGNRTASRFFPFTVAGPDETQLFGLRPDNVWGEGSLYSWIESHDLQIVTIGLPPYVCSVQHRAEFLQRSKVPYREELSTSGEVIIRGKREILSETLLARIEGVEVDFRPLAKLFEENGQRVLKSDGIVISSISAKTKISLVSEAIEQNPWICAIRQQGVSP